MKEPQFRVVTLDAALDRSGFCCGTEPLDRYFREQVTQDTRRRVAACFVAHSPDGRVAGFYTLASAGVPLSRLLAEVARKLPRYPEVPTVRMGRLAVDRGFKGQGLGGALLADALARVARSEIAAYALIVDAMDEDASSFYRHHGFIPLPDSPLTLFLPLASARSLLDR